jgi:MFS family permease
MLAVLTLVSAVNWADRSVVPILFPPIREEMGLSDTELGIIGGLAFSAVYAVAAFAFGYAADRKVRKNLIAFGLVLWSLATAASGLATDFASLFAARFFTGLGEASLYPAAMSLIAERFPTGQRGRAMGVFATAAAAVGSGLGISLGGVLAANVGWRWVFFIYGGIGIFLLPAVLSIIESPRQEVRGQEDGAFATVARLFGDRRLLGLWAAGTVMIMAGMGYISWVPSYFVRVRGFDVATAGYVFGLTALGGGIVGGLLGGYLADRRRARRFGGELEVSAAMALLAVPATMITLWAQPTVLYLGGAVIMAVAFYAFFPPTQTMLMELVPARNHGMAYAVNILFLGGIGSSLGPFIVGGISDRSGSLSTAMIAPIIGMVVAGLIMVVLSAYIGRRTPAES